MFSMRLPPVLAGECSAALPSVGEAWVRDAHQRLQTLGHWPSEASRVAVCIQGGVRTFTHPKVYLSVRDNLLQSLNSSYLRLCFKSGTMVLRAQLDLGQLHLGTVRSAGGRATMREPDPPVPIA